MKGSACLFTLTLGLILFFLVALPAQAAPLPQSTEQPVVHAVLFWMNGCPHCHEVLEHVLPPLQEKYGAQLEILLVEVVNMDDVNRLYEVAAAYGIPREQVGVPFLVIGDRVLIGSQQIPEELPDLIESYLLQGGVGLPQISALGDFENQTTPTPMDRTLHSSEDGVVRATLFTTLDCRDCQLEVGAAFGPVRETFGAQFELQTIDIATASDVDYLYKVAARFGLSEEEVELPMLIIGDQILIGAEMSSRLLALVEEYAQAGGVDYPALPAREDAAQTHLQDVSGFELAIVTMGLIIVALFYSLVAILLGKAFKLPALSEELIPFLITVGMLIAAYLAYVETQSKEAFCGPIGDCNTVQQSRYARLFGVLSVGTFGLLGYIALLVAWVVKKSLPRFKYIATLGLWGMALFGALFSFYLTYLEIFVIRAVCLWCLSSAALIALLLFIATPPVVRVLANPKAVAWQIEKDVQ